MTVETFHGRRDGATFPVEVRVGRLELGGEPFVDRQLVVKVRYAKQKGIREVGMISNGSLITEAVARGMIEAGLDAIGRPQQVAMVGDRIDTDISGAQAIGIAGILVTTGATSAEELADSPIEPDHLIGSLSELLG